MYKMVKYFFALFFHISFISLYGPVNGDRYIILALLGIKVSLLLNIGDKAYFHQYARHGAACQHFKALLLYTQVVPSSIGKLLLYLGGKHHTFTKECLCILGHDDGSLR